ncbi:MAG: hypothetical protein ABI683_07460 [Ginsengibacter sp.]
MKNRKKVIVIINEFPEILFMITRMIDHDNEDYIFDASEFSKPVALLTITQPDELLLNLKLPSREALKFVEVDMQNNWDISQGMITSNPKAFYMSLCQSLCTNYFVDNHTDLEQIPEVIARQQLN